MDYNARSSLKYLRASDCAQHNDLARAFQIIFFFHSLFSLCTMYQNFYKFFFSTIFNNINISFSRVVLVLTTNRHTTNRHAPFCTCAQMSFLCSRPIVRTQFLAPIFLRPNARHPILGT